MHGIAVYLWNAGNSYGRYSGNDFARYSIAENRWNLDQPPRFPPFLEGTNAGICSRPADLSSS